MPTFEEETRARFTESQWKQKVSGRERDAIRRLSTLLEIGDPLFPAVVGDHVVFWSKVSGVKDAIFFVLFGLLLLCMVWLNVMGARDKSTAEFQREAVSVGAAEYYVDPVTGDVKWRWKGLPEAVQTPRQGSGQDSE